MLELSAVMFVVVRNSYCLVLINSEQRVYFSSSIYRLIELDRRPRVIRPSTQDMLFRLFQSEGNRPNAKGGETRYRTREVLLPTLATKVVQSSVST